MNRATHHWTNPPDVDWHEGVAMSEGLRARFSSTGRVGANPHVRTPMNDRSDFGPRAGAWVWRPGDERHAPWLLSTMPVGFDHGA